MKNETKENFESTIRLTQSSLEKLKGKGFWYAQGKGFLLNEFLCQEKMHTETIYA
jgi:hypothetical protein